MKRILPIFSLLIIVSACNDIVQVEDISNKTVVLLAPTNQAVLNITDLTFSWQEVEEAESYHIQVATPTFEQALQIVVDSTLSATSFSTTLELGNYQWRIRAENSGYQTIYTTQSFTIEE